MAENEGVAPETIPKGVAPETIPKARFDAVVAERRAAEQRATAAEAKVAELTPLQAGLEEHERALTGWRAKEASWTDERTILGAGISDPDGVDFARHAWGRVAPEARPAGGLKEWLGNPAGLPKAVQAYLPTAPAAPSTPAAPGGVAAVVLPRANAGVVPNVSPSGKLTKEQIDAYAKQAAAGTMPAAEWRKIAADVLSGAR